MQDKKSFILFIDRKKEIDMLTDEQCGVLFKAMFEYVDTGNETIIDDLAVKLMFSVFKAQIDENTARWEETKKKRSEAGKKGGRPKNQTKAKKANAFSEKQTKAKKAVTVTDTVTVTETVTETNKNKSAVSEKQQNTPKKRYGEYRHILLTDSEYEKLIKDYGEKTTKEYIDKIDRWIQLKGKSSYSDYSLAVRNWINKDGVQRKEEVYDKYAGTAAMQGII